MGKTPERRVFTSASSSSALHYRRKVPAPADNQHPEQQPTDPKQDEPKQLKPHQPLQQQQLKQEQSCRSSRSPADRRFRTKPRQPKQQQPALLKQLLWKAKAVQPTPSVLKQQSRRNEEEDEEEEEEVAFAREQRQARKLLASEAEAALAATKRKTAGATAVPSLSESFVAESSSQETQSGSEDEAIFLPYSDLLLAVQPSAKWRVDTEQGGGGAGSAEETDGEETASPVMPSEPMETTALKSQMKEQDGLEKAAATRRKQRQRYKLKQKQKRAAAKEQKRLQHHQKQENEQPHPPEEDTGSTQDDESATVDIFHPPTNLASEMDAGVCRAVLSQLKEVVPYIVVGDVACPVVAGSDEHLVGGAIATDQGEASAADSEVAIVDFRQHVIAMLDRSKETQVQYRESFVVENSSFDAASSYDFFKHRFCEIQRSAGIVYY